MLKYGLAGSLAALLLLQTGCALLSQKDSGARRYIEPDASYIQLEEFHDPVLRLRQWADAANREVLRSQLPDGRKRELCTLLAAVRLWVRQIGLAENTAYAASGAPLTIRGERCWKTSRAWYFGPDAEKALLYRLAGSRTMSLQTELARCPADVLLAVSVELNTEEIAAAVESAADVLTGKAPRELTGFIRALSGRWTLQVHPSGTGESFRLSVPDRQGKVHALLKQLLPAGRDGRILLPGIGGMPPLTVMSAPDELILTSGVRKYAGPMLADVPAMRERLKYLPAPCSGYCYVTPRFGKKLLKQYGGNMPFPEMPGILGVLRREPDALVLHTVSSWDPVSEEYLVPAIAFGANAAFAAMRTGDQLRADSRDRVVWTGCAEHLQTIGSGLQQYAKRHQGKFPAGNDIAGLRELLEAKLVTPEQLICPAVNGDTPAKTAAEFGYDHCSYVYIGGSDSSTPGDFPLIFDWPLNHRNKFHVVFVNGKMAEFSMDRLDSCRKLASFLQSRFRYPEKDFRRLREVADKLDAKFLKGHSK